MKLVVVSILWCLVGASVAAADVCVEGTPPDERVYTFSFEQALEPFSFVNRDGEQAGYLLDVMRLICDVMNKKCKALLNPFHLCWDNKNTSQALNNRWWDVCGDIFQTAARRAAMAFVTQYTNMPKSHIFVRKGSFIRTAEDLKNSAIGFIKGWWLTPSCVASTIGVSLEGTMKRDYPSYSDMSSAVLRGEVDAMVIFADAADYTLFDQVDTEPIYCSLSGFSMMVRKDMLEGLSWIDEGVQKLKENGDYKWMCNMVKKNSRVDPACLV